MVGQPSRIKRSLASIVVLVVWAASSLFAAPDADAQTGSTPTWADAITIDIGESETAVPDTMFGTNTIFGQSDGFRAWQARQIDNLTSGGQEFSLIRWPGGTVAERLLNLDNPDFYLTGSAVPAHHTLESFVSAVNNIPCPPIPPTTECGTASIVLPTKRYKDGARLLRAEARSDTKAFVLELFSQQRQWTILEDRTLVFEIGNEYRVPSAGAPTISTLEYARIARQVALGIRDARRALALQNRTDLPTIKVAVQLGMTEAETDLIGQHFADIDVDALIIHWYTDFFEVQHGCWAWHGEALSFDQRLSNLTAKFGTAGRNANLPVFMSEYNTNVIPHANLIGPGQDTGLRAPLNQMSAFAGAIRGSAQMAAIWPPRWRSGAHTLFVNGYFKSLGGGNWEPTFNGVHYQWLAENLQGKSIVSSNAITNPTLSDQGCSLDNGSYDHSFRDGMVYVEAFEGDTGEVVLLIYNGATAANGSNNRLRIRLENYVAISKIKSVGMTSTSNDPQDFNGNPVIDTARVVHRWTSSGGTNVTVDLDKPYEVVMVVLQGATSYR